MTTGFILKSWLKDMVDIPVNEHVQEEVVQEHEHDLGMNMDDFVEDVVNSPIHEAEGNVVTENDSSSSSSETILPVSEETNSDASRDFCSDHYERLAEIPLANAGKRIKSQARRPRRKSVRDPPSGSVLGERTLVDESSDTDKDANFVASLIVTPPRSKDSSPVITPVPPVITPSPSVPQSSAVLTLQTQVDTLVSTDSQRQLVIQTQANQIADMQALVSKLVERLNAQGELRIHDTCHTEFIQIKDDEDNDPTGNAEGDLQYADINPISTVQGESTSQTIEGNKDASRVNEEILLLEFFADSEEEEAEKIECLEDIDELFNDIEDDVSDKDVEEGEIVEIEIEKNKDNVIYEGCDGLKVPYNFIQDDVIPEFSYEGVTDSMDSIEDITVPEDTAASKMDINDENVQSNIDAEADTTHTVSPKVNEEPVMYRNTGMTREQWREVVNSWMKGLPKSQAQPTQKEKYVNKERCIGRIISWFYDNDTKLFAIKRSDGVQYLKPRIKYFNTLPRCEMNGLASKPLINRSKFGLADVIANMIKREGGSGKYEKLKPQKGKRVRIIDQKTGKVTWKYRFKPVRVVHKISLKKIPQDFLGNMKWWYVDLNTGEARIEDKDNKIIVCFYDAMNLINFSKKDQRTLRKNEIMFTDEWKEQVLQYKRVNIAPVRPPIELARQTRARGLGVSEEVLLLELFADSEEEEAEKIECLDDIDELFNDIQDDVSDNDVEEGEIVEIEIEKNKDNVTYEASDGLKVPYNFIQDDVIPEFSYEGVTDSMGSIEDITVPEDTAESKMDINDENVQSNIDVKADTTHTVSPKVNEEPVMYRNTGMTREQWREFVNSWMKVLPKSQAQRA
ncbi:hypothetical protein L1987_57764 [Smallanthus sonchifolius]|uniref:Uncharacterized protein n=1 Tax=Smallanthus sonchifolius TaxID=185202 RepID=A0ACB9DDR0_9ASTR|nr:hypothetical protein L1987_57764 [Smallanthus sonchifolius]